MPSKIKRSISRSASTKQNQNNGGYPVAYLPQALSDLCVDHPPHNAEKSENREYGSRTICAQIEYTGECIEQGRGRTPPCCWLCNSSARPHAGDGTRWRPQLLLGIRRLMGGRLP